MTRCEVCGNEYDATVELELGCEIEIFDKFETAFYSIAPICAHCNQPIFERGIEVAGTFFCCASCACEYKMVGLQKPSDQYLVGEISFALGEAVC